MGKLVALVQKKGWFPVSTLSFYIDYWSLKSVTKSDTFQLLRIDDHLDQLGNA